MNNVVTPIIFGDQSAAVAELRSCFFKFVGNGIDLRSDPFILRLSEQTNTKNAARAAFYVF
jgi:hypothetical protein